MAPDHAAMTFNGYAILRASLYAALSGPLVIVAMALLKVGSAVIVASWYGELLIAAAAAMIAFLVAGGVIVTIGFLTHCMLQRIGWTGALAYVLAGTLWTVLPCSLLVLRYEPNPLLLWIGWCGPLCAFVLWREQRRYVPSTLPIS